MITAQEIFNLAMDFMDKRNPTGTIDTTKTARYRVRTPNILTSWQNENFSNGNIFKTHEITQTKSEPQVWIKYDLPDDLRNIDQIIDILTIGQEQYYIKPSEYKLEGLRDFYISSLFEGTTRIVYKAIPIPITDLSQSVEVDSITAIGGAYFLAAHLLLTEDPSTASFFNDRYTEYTNKVNVKSPASIKPITDVYSIMNDFYF